MQSIVHELIVWPSFIYLYSELEAEIGIIIDTTCS